MAGLGGQGVLMVGKLLTQAATANYRHVLWFPSYYQAVRGGDCECTVILSDEDIASPILPQASSVVIMDASQIEHFENRVRPGGLLLLASTAAAAEVTRKDIEVLSLPAVETAAKLGAPQMANMVLLGAYLGVREVIPPQLIEQEMEKTFGGREEALSLNKKAFRQGLELGQRLAGGRGAGSRR